MQGPEVSSERYMGPLQAAAPYSSSVHTELSRGGGTRGEAAEEDSSKILGMVGFRFTTGNLRGGLRTGFYGVTVSTWDSESQDPSSNLGRTFFFLS